MAFQPLENVPLAPFTTLELGGPARYFAEPGTDQGILAGLDFAARRSLPVLILGGGSNLVVADAGFPGVVLRPCMRGKKFIADDRLLVAAGEPFDDVVAFAAEQGRRGLECLSGIPGAMGAAPVQNIGAYGQEVADTIQEVRVLDRLSMTFATLSRQACDFGYRDSLFKRTPHRYVILDVTLRLEKGPPAPPRNEELRRALPDGADAATLRDTVLRVRRGKGMVYDQAQPHHRTAGSFFVNPVVDGKQTAWIVATALARGKATSAEAVPRHVLADGRVKIPAAWLIEASGLAKGYRQGTVGISPHHALALVHHGGGTTSDLLRLAKHIQLVVFDAYGVRLAHEPVFVGIDDEIRLD
jgi:UDP-N-acetylmuramate dehydrogenase